MECLLFLKHLYLGKCNSYNTFGDPRRESDGLFSIFQNRILENATPTTILETRGAKVVECLLFLKHLHLGTCSPYITFGHPRRESDGVFALFLKFLYISRPSP